MSDELQAFKDAAAQSAFGETKGMAHIKGTCINCKASVFFDIRASAGEQHIPGAVYTPAGLKEYDISGLCEYCWDDMFA